MSRLPALDAFQQAVVDSNATSIRVVAPAGSGKTETLAHRVRSRIDAGIAPHRILLLTFDNNARQSVVQKLQALNVPDTVRVSTLNAFGYQLLNARFTDERRRMIRDVYFPASPVLNELVTEYGHSVFTEMLSKIKNSAIDPRTIEFDDLTRWCSRNREHLLRDLEDDPVLQDVSAVRFGRELAREMQGYEQFLEQLGGIDFDDQKLRPLLRLQQHERELQRLQQAFDDVIVDEFQDINRLDVMLINLITGQSSLLITGDDDQAIYGFRGATADFLIHPEQELHRDFTEFELSINYRCPPRVLDAARRLIAFNEHRIDKHPSAHKPQPGQIEVHKEQDTDGEYDWIAQRMKELLREKPGPAAVLARRRSQMPGIQSAMIRAGTPYRVDVKEDLRVSWSLALRALKLAPLRVGKVPDAAVRAEITRIFARARNFAMQRTDQLVRLAELDDFVFPGPELQQQLFDRERKDLADGIKALIGEISVFSRLRMMDSLLNTKIRTYMDGGQSEARDRGDKDASRLSGLIDLVSEKGMSTRALIARVDSLLEMQRSALRGSIPTVELATCHGAKGREWQLVCIPHCNSGVFPDSRSSDGIHLEAERKLFYVSMTRASEHLIATWSPERRDEPGTFLIEAGLAESRKTPSPGRVTTYRADGPRLPQSSAPGRKLSPDGHWAMKAAPKKVHGPAPRYLTLDTSRIRSMQNALDIDACRILADAIDMQHDDREIALDRMRVLFSRSDATCTVPMQIELALRGTPFAIAEAHRFPDAGVFLAAMQAWSSDTSPKSDPRDAPLIDALAAMMERITGSDDSWVWLDRLEQLLNDGSLGADETGIQFVPQ